MVNALKSSGVEAAAGVVSDDPLQLRVRTSVVSTAHTSMYDDEPDWDDDGNDETTGAAPDASVSPSAAVGTQALSSSSSSSGYVVARWALICFFVFCFLCTTYVI